MPIQHEDLPWTTSRCNRLLRTITSRVNVLRKLSRSIAPSVPVTSDGRSIDIPRGSRRGSVVFTGNSPSKEPEWLPVAKRRVDKRTYGGRARTGVTGSTTATCKASQATPYGSRKTAYFSTPFLKRALGATDGDVAVWNVRATFLNTGKYVEAKGMWKRFKSRPAGTKEEVLNNLVEAFDGLLSSTNASIGRSRIGCRSLMNTCLARIPSYIALEEEWRSRDDNDDDTNVSEEVYSDLESLASGTNCGWPWLRDVARAHGVEVVCKAVQDGLVPEASCNALIRTCQRHSAIREAQGLFLAWLNRPRKFESAGNETSERPAVINALLAFSNGVHSSEFHFQFLTEAVKSGKLTVQAMLSNKSSFPWPDLVHLLSGTDVSAAGADFVMEMLNAVSRGDLKQGTDPRASEEAQTGLASVVTLMTAMELCRDTTTDVESESATYDRVGRVQHLLARLGMVCLQQPEQTQSESRTLRTRPSQSDFAVATSCLLCLPHGPAINSVLLPSTETICARLQQQPSSLTSSFIYGVAKCAGRATNDSGISPLRKIVCRLTSLSSDASAELFLNQLALDCARNFADRSPAREHYGFVEELEKSMPLGTVTFAALAAQTPSAKLNNTGFRWEDSICEWITATPFAVGSKPVDPMPERKIDGEGLLTPPTSQAHTATDETTSFDSLCQHISPETFDCDTPVASRSFVKVAESDTSPDVLAVISPVVRLPISVFPAPSPVPKKSLKRQLSLTFTSNTEIVRSQKSKLKTNRNSESNKENTGHSDHISLDRDELGILTPAVSRTLPLSESNELLSRNKRLPHGRMVCQSNGRGLRRSMSDTRLFGTGDGSDDELGL